MSLNAAVCTQKRTISRMRLHLNTATRLAVFRGSLQIELLYSCNCTFKAVMMRNSCILEHVMFLPCKAILSLEIRDFSGSKA